MSAKKISRIVGDTATLLVNAKGKVYLATPKLKEGESVPEYAMYVAACAAIWNCVKERRMVIQLFQDLQQEREHPLLAPSGIVVVPAGAIR